MSLTVLPEAEAEAAQAAMWYENKQAGLGNEFLNELETAFQIIESNPTGQPLLESTDPPIRRTLIKRFPYLVIFAVRDEDVLVIAVAHAHRKPGYWSDRVS